jgi:hypothetical protein
MKRLLALFALTLPLLFAFAACGDSGPASSTGDDPSLLSCTSPPLCDPLTLPASCTFKDDGITCAVGDAGTDAGESDAGESDAGPPAPVSTARLQCALEALRDGKTGGLYLLLPDHGSTSCGVRVEILSFGDGTASVLPVGYCDFSFSRGTPERRVIQPASFFEKCLADTDDARRVECIAKAITTKAASGGTCACRGIHADDARGGCSSE